MVSEVLTHLFDGVPPRGRLLVVDGTVGLGGHAEAILAARSDACVLGLDRDPEALSLAEQRLRPHAGRYRLVHASFADLGEVLATSGEGPADAILLDLGLSSHQIDSPERGFSFQRPGLGADMRFDRSAAGPTALDLVNRLREADLARLLFDLGEEPRARAVARALVLARPIEEGRRLAEVVRRAARRTRRHDPATRSFQALRMAVNDEIGHLERGLEAALAHLAPGGRLVVISFHSGEDRRVKEALRRAGRDGVGVVRTRKPARPTEDEVRTNPRARPARLRAFARDGQGGTTGTEGMGRAT
jgi:16S rRNA (cytosine1402-N4)-methyltransferase